MQIKPRQIPAYDAASREIEKAADIIEAISVAGLDTDARVKLYALLKSARELRHELFHAAHAAFVRARMGEE
jgi:hypothetical protein